MAHSKRENRKKNCLHFLVDRSRGRAFNCPMKTGRLETTKAGGSPLPRLHLSRSLRPVHLAVADTSYFVLALTATALLLAGAPRGAANGGQAGALPPASTPEHLAVERVVPKLAPPPDRFRLSEQATE